MKFPPQMLPGSPADKYPEAPAGTIFVVGPERGYAVPPCRYTLLFGRDREDVHVPVGVDDPAVSRAGRGVHLSWPRQRVVAAQQRELAHRTASRRLAAGRALAGNQPRIHAAGDQLLPAAVPPGRGPGPRRARPGTLGPFRGDPTAPPGRRAAIELSAPERLVLTALARRYLEGHDDNLLPLIWKETARVANSSPYATRVWNERTVADTVERVRKRLHDRGVYGLVEAEVGQPVGTTLNVNLIRELLKTATLGSQDLALLPGDD